MKIWQLSFLNCNNKVCDDIFYETSSTSKTKSILQATHHYLHWPASVVQRKEEKRKAPTFLNIFDESLFIFCHFFHLIQGIVLRPSNSKA